MIFEEQVQEIAQQFDYPATPDVAGRVVFGRKSPRSTYRLAYAIAIALILCASLLAVPEVRATVVSVLRFGVVTVVDEPLTVAAPIYQLPDLPGQTTLAEARAKVPIVLPSVLGEPDAIFLHTVFSDAVTLYWQEEQIVLQQLGDPIFAAKLQPLATEEAQVNGERAVWITGAHWLTLYDDQYTPIAGMQRFVEGNVLIWQVGDLTYRLETAHDLEDALRIAESVRD